MAAATDNNNSNEPVIIGRYAIFDEVARGGMATVHVGRLCGPGGFTRTVAVKRLHPGYATDPEFVAMFLDEARLAARIQHPNVVSVLDVVATKGELFMVMEYIHGESLSNLLRASRAELKEVPVAIAAQLVTNLLFGLHAAHEAASDKGEPLGIVHRDVSPQNVLVGTDGVARVVDFGVAKAAQRMHETKDGSVKGKVSYMSPEQLSAKDDVDRRTDIWAASVILWEALAGRRLFDFDELGQTVGAILGGRLDPPSRHTAVTLPKGLDEIILKGLATKPEDRWATAEEMALALEALVPPIATRVVAKWVESTADERLRARADIISRTEHKSIPPLALMGAAGSTPPLSSSSSPTNVALMTGPQIPFTPKPMAASRGDATALESSASLHIARNSHHHGVSQADSLQPRVIREQAQRRLRVAVGVSIALGVFGLGMIIRFAIHRPSIEGSPIVATTSESATATATTTTLPPPAEPATAAAAGTAVPTATARAVAAPHPSPSAARAGARATVAKHDPTPPPPTVTPAAPPPTPTPTVAPPPPEPARAKFVVASARVDVGAASNASGTTSANVNRVIAPLAPRITECYRAALPKMTGAVEGSGNLHIETDEDGVITKASVSGAVTGANACIASSTTGKKIPNVDTGRAHADIPLVFRAQ